MNVCEPIRSHLCVFIALWHVHDHTLCCAALSVVVQIKKES